MPREEIRREEIESFAAKLESWGHSLPPKERAILFELLRHTRLGEPPDPDVAGYAFGLPAFRQTTVNILSPLRRGSFAGSNFWAQWSQRQY